MSASESWKFSLSFTERFSVVNQIATALKTSHGIDQGEAIKTAQALEEDCFKRAASLEEYTYYWHQELTGITAASFTIRYPDLPPPSPTTARDFTSHEDLPMPGCTPSLGPYPNTTHHASGITSVVYKSHIPSTHHSFHNPANFPTPPGLVVALKATSPSTLQPPHNSHYEATILNSLLPHPNIIPLLETFNAPGAEWLGLTNFVLVFPFCPYTLLTLHIPLSQPLILHILKGTISALVHLHKHDVIHRDVKPSNILLYPSPPVSTSAQASPFPNVYLADYGAAWSPQTHSTTEPPENKIIDIGTTHYRALEVLFGYKGYGTELDLWALGCVVAECYMNLSRHDPETHPWITLFDAGELGSELRLIASIFETLGTPSDETWQGSSKLPDWGKIQFKDFPRRTWEDILPFAPRAARDLADKLLKYDGDERITADKALQHELFKAAV